MRITGNGYKVAKYVRYGENGPDYIAIYKETNRLPAMASTVAAPKHEPLNY